MARLDDQRTAYPQLELVGRADYEGASYETVGGVEIPKPALAGDTLWVALRPAALRYLLDPGQLILLELPIDPAQSIGSDTRSLLLDPRSGEILYRSAKDIGYRVGWFGDAQDPTKDGWRGNQDTIYGPLRGVLLQTSLPAVGGYGLTDEEGKYRLHYMLPPCPGFVFEYTNALELQLHYRRFNPRGSPLQPYILWRDGWDVCNGLSVWTYATFGIVATAPSYSTRIDFPVDLMVLSGRARVADSAGRSVPVGEGSAFDGSAPALERVAEQQYDLDGDGEPDTALLGREETVDGETRLVAMDAQQDPPLQGVWLSSLHGASPDTADTPPDLTRLADWGADFEDRGLLGSLSENGLKDTDLYLFRESDGTLIAERKGLDPDELIARWSGVDAERGLFHYTIHLPQGRYARFSPGGSFNSRGLELAQWQAAGGMNPKLYAREADHLRPGERVRLIAINRASGYLGSLGTELKPAGSGADAGEISFPVEEPILRPPSLKLWAERQYEVPDGLSRGETRDYRIGQEGAAETGDRWVVVHSEWLDADGRPLPAGLGDEYGYTGRLAQVVGENALAPVGGEGVAHFAIRPGRQIQVVRLPEGQIGKRHLYVQVSGEPSSRNPDFAAGDAAGLLAHRPARFVPVQVKVDPGGPQRSDFGQRRNRQQHRDLHQSARGLAPARRQFPGRGAGDRFAERQGPGRFRDPVGSLRHRSRTARAHRAPDLGRQAYRRPGGHRRNRLPGLRCLRQSGDGRHAGLLDTRLRRDLRECRGLHRRRSGASRLPGRRSGGRQPGAGPGWRGAARRGDRQTGA
jgi:hypothetical protein